MFRVHQIENSVVPFNGALSNNDAVLAFSTIHQANHLNLILRYISCNGKKYLKFKIT
jgi:hypothetical protein